MPMWAMPMWGSMWDIPQVLVEHQYGHHNPNFHLPEASQIASHKHRHRLRHIGKLLEKMTPASFEGLRSPQAQPLIPPSATPLQGAPPICDFGPNRFHSGEMVLLDHEKTYIFLPYGNLS